MMTPTAKHLQTVTSRGTEHPWHESAVCRKIDQISSLRQCRYAVQWQANDARHGTRQEDRTIPRWKAEGEVLVPLAA